MSSSRSRYPVTLNVRGVDKRAEEIHDIYVDKARSADQRYGGVAEGEQGRVEAKLLSYPKVAGLVFGNWGEASEAVHSLIDELATRRAQVTDPESRRMGGRLPEEVVKSLAVSYLRRRLSIAGVRAQCLSLLGRLEVMGSSNMLVERRRRSLQQEDRWKKDRLAHQIAEKQGFNALRRGFAKWY